MFRSISGFLLILLSPNLLAQLADDCKLDIGINLSGVSDYSTEVPFVNLMKMARTWYTKSVGDPNNPWDSDQSEELSYRSDGYPTEIPQTVSTSTYPQQVATVWDGTSGWPAGEYVVLWEGTGTLDLWGGATNVQVAGTNRITFDYNDPTDGLLQLTILSSDVVDPVRNIRVLMPGTESSYSTQPYNQIWLDRVSAFRTLRFMDWGSTNGWGQDDQYSWNDPTLFDWADRSQPDFYTYTTNKGVPYEVMVDLVNYLDVDAWFCIPHRASDDYLEEMAEFFRDNLESDRHIYIEYSNENWNWIFGQAQWLNEYGCVQKGISWPEGIVPYIQNALDHWTEAFSGQLHRLTRVCGVQTSWKDVSERMTFNLTQNSFDAVSPTFYFGLSGAGDAALDALGTSATAADVAFHARASMQDNMDGMRDMADISATLNKSMIFYEGGQHITPDPFGETPTYAQALLEVHRDTSMYNMYNEWYDSIRTLQSGSEPLKLVHFSFASPLSARFGSWGILESINQDINFIPAPKYLSTIENMSTCLEPVDIQLTANAIEVFSNPVPGYFSVKGATGNFDIYVEDAWGALYEQYNTSQDILIEMATVPSNHYIVVAHKSASNIYLRINLP